MPCSVHPFLNSGILVHETTCTRELNNVTERRGLLWLARNTTFSPGVDLPERPLRVLRAERLPVGVPRAALRRDGEGAEVLVREVDEELGKGGVVGGEGGRELRRVCCWMRCFS